jgi:acetylornithine deacetylase/succinyl-diaminopimelate desuccinylase
MYASDLYEGQQRSWLAALGLAGLGGAWAERRLGEERGSDALVGQVSAEEQDLGRALAAHMPDEEIVRITADSVRIESHRSAPGHETPYAEYLHRLLVAEGIESELVDVSRGRLNVIGTLRGTGEGPRLILNGHTDTVPPGTMKDAFEPRLEGGNLWGRGSCDMKGGLVAQLCAMIALKRAGIRLGGDLIFTGAIAEEDATNLGSIDVVRNGPRADMVVVAEPTGLKVAVAHKGFDYYRIEVGGISAHSSRPDKGVSAIYRASAIVRAIEQRLAPALSTVVHPLVGAATINVSSIIGYATSEIATVFGRGPLLKPAGGTVPDTCTVTLDHRRLPGSDDRDMLRRLEALVAEVAGDGPPVTVHFTPACPELDSHPPLDTDPAHPLVREALRLASTIGGAPAEAVGVPFWSDGALFNAGWKVPAIVFGPGNIAVAHSDHESVPVDELVKATRINALLAASLLGVR